MYCKNSNKQDLTHSAFVGGEIINPYSNYVYFNKKSRILKDSAVLNNKNRFKYKFKDLKPGFYYFFHGREKQSILIEPNDSLMLRLNTYDFDESIVFSGKGAKKNNYLMDLFLDNEKDVKGTILYYSQLNPKLFNEKLEQLRAKKIKRLNAFKKKNNTSELFDEIAFLTINYDYYNAKEFYPFANYRKGELEIFNSLPKDFYSYRKNINYNYKKLRNYLPYRSFLRFNINNIALEKHFKHSKDSVYNEYSLDYNLEKLTTIDSLITDKTIKNFLLNYTTIIFINGSQNTLDYEPILKSFIEKNTNKIQITNAKQLVKTYQRLKPGEPLPSITLLDENNNSILLSEVIKRPSIVYFWDVKNKNHLIDSHKRVQELKLKYPNFDFLAISTNDISLKEQQQILKHLKLVNSNEFRFKTSKEAVKTLAIKPINNVFLINKAAEIINPKANMFSVNFEQYLANLAETNNSIK